jgi:hypothetical protein
MTRCFISHSSKDRAFVEEELIGVFDALGLEPWYSKEDINAAEEWERSIKKGLESSEWFAVVLSPRSQSSSWVRDEVHWAFSHRGGRIIPILLEECDPQEVHLRLPRVQHIDYSRQPKKAQLTLIRTIRDALDGLVIRSPAISGEWAGVVYQYDSMDSEPSEFVAEATLIADRKSISGRIQVQFPEKLKRPIDGPGPLSVQFKVTGGLMYERYLQLNYLSEDPAVVQFGAWIMELDDHAQELTGRYIGYGAYSKTIVFGLTKLTKRSSSAST